MYNKSHLFICFFVLISLKSVFSFNEKPLNANSKSIQQKFIINPLITPIENKILSERQEEFKINNSKKVIKGINFTNNYFQLSTLMLLMLPMRIIHQIQSLKYHIFAIISSVILYGMKRDDMQSAILNAIDCFKAFCIKLFSKTVNEINLLSTTSSDKITTTTNNNNNNAISIKESQNINTVANDSINKFISPNLSASSLTSPIPASVSESTITSSLSNMANLQINQHSHSNNNNNNNKDIISHTMPPNDQTKLITNNIKKIDKNSLIIEEYENDAVMNILTGVVAGTVIGGPVGGLAGGTLTAVVVQEQMQKVYKGWRLNKLMINVKAKFVNKNISQ